VTIEAFNREIMQRSGTVVDIDPLLANSQADATQLLPIERNGEPDSAALPARRKRRS